MVAGNKDKKLKVAERGEEDNNQIDEELVLSIEKLQEIQDDLEFLSHPALGTLLSEEDQKIFKFLSSLQVEDSKDVNSGYSITSYFEPNPYFEETKLIKSFAFHDEGTTEIAATPISWKGGMGLQNGVSHENKGKKRLLADESFLRWFSSTQPKGMIDDMQDEVAEIIKEDLWPSPLSYFNTDPYKRTLTRMKLMKGNVFCGRRLVCLK